MFRELDPATEFAPKMQAAHKVAEGYGDHFAWYYHIPTECVKVHREQPRGSCVLTRGEINLFAPEVLYDFIVERTAGQEAPPTPPPYPKWGAASWAP